MSHQSSRSGVRQPQVSRPVSTATLTRLRSTGRVPSPRGHKRGRSTAHWVAPRLGVSTHSRRGAAGDDPTDAVHALYHAGCDAGVFHARAAPLRRVPVTSASHASAFKMCAPPGAPATAAELLLTSPPSPRVRDCRHGRSGAAAARGHGELAQSLELLVPPPFTCVADTHCLPTPGGHVPCRPGWPRVVGHGFWFPSVPA